MIKGVGCKRGGRPVRVLPEASLNQKGKKGEKVMLNKVSTRLRYQKLLQDTLEFH